MNRSSYIKDMPSTTDDIGTEDSEVIKFYNGCNILITGGSGFLGKLLIHKLLASCPKLGKLFILMRPKKGKTPSERLKEMFEDTIYETLHRDQPNFINRCILIEGDISESDLGLSCADRDFIIENINIVIHGAATIRFEDSLRTVITINVKGTKLMLELAKKMSRLKAFVHLSTAFSHLHQDYIEEKYYEPPISVEKALTLIDLLDDEELKLLTPKLVGKFRKTYFFSKALGEEVVRVYGAGLPVCIVRPSIVIATMYEPIRGWVDNISGVNGLLVGVANLAIFRTQLLDESIVLDLIPADFVVNNIIVAAWDVNKQSQAKCGGKTSNPLELDTITEDSVPIYNCVSSCQNPITLGDIFKLSIKHGTEVISSKAMWYSIFISTKSKWLYYIYDIFLHHVAAIIMDGLAKLTGRKTKFYAITKKIKKFCDTVHFAFLQQWSYDNRTVINLWDKMNSTDRNLFYFNMKNLDWNEFFIFYTKGMRVFLLKEPMSNLKASITRYKRLKVAHFTMVGIFTLILLWIVIVLYANLV